MPKNTPLPMQWLTVDGQNVPIVLPDHWDDDKKEWKTTGTGNPLPIANYTQNTSGVWLPTSESNPMPTQLTGSNLLETFAESSVRNSTQTFNLTPPKWAKGAMIYMRVFGATGDLSGSTSGINLEVRLRQDVSIAGTVGDKFKGDCMVLHTFQRGSRLGDNDLVMDSTREVKVVGIQIPTSQNSLQVVIRVVGSFGSGEGFHSQGKVEWLN